MRRTFPRPTSDPAAGAGAGFTLIEAVAALAVAVLLAVAAASLANSALERERRARRDSDAARAVANLSARLAAPGEGPEDPVDLPGGWRAVRVDAGGRDPEAWTGWGVVAPGEREPHHVFHVPPAVPAGGGGPGGAEP